MINALAFAIDVSLDSTLVRCGARTRSARHGRADWVSEVVRSMREHAEHRDTERLSKETSFSARRMRSRLDERDAPSPLCLDAVTESSKASYLRRKRRQGKAEFRDTISSDSSRS